MATPKKEPKTKTAYKSKKTTSVSRAKTSRRSPSITKPTIKTEKAKATTKKSTAPKKTTTQSKTSTTKPKQPAAKAKAAAKTPATKKTAAKKATQSKKVDSKVANDQKTPVSTSAKSSKTNKAPKTKSAKDVGKSPNSDGLKKQPVKSDNKGTPVSTAAANKTASPTIAAAKRPTKRVIKRDPNARQDFKVGEKIVYPAHGVGKIIDKEKQSIAGMDIELFVIDFEHEKMRLRVPIQKTLASGMRALSSNDEIGVALKTLEGRARVKRTMWSRRAKEYEDKINSGSLKAVAEVVRDLYRSAEQPEQSYSERQLYEAAVDRMAREVACVREVDHSGAVSEMETWLHKKQPVAT